MPTGALSGRVDITKCSLRGNIDLPSLVKTELKFALYQTLDATPSPEKEQK